MTTKPKEKKEPDIRPGHHLNCADCGTPITLPHPPRYGDSYTCSTCAWRINQLTMMHED